MNLMKKLTLRQYTQNKVFNKIIEDCLQFKELDEYLKCLDMQACLQQGDYLESESMARMNKLKQYETSTIKVLQSKMVEIVLSSGIRQEYAIHTASIIEEQLGDEDFVDNQIDNNFLAKLYIIVKEIRQALELIKPQEKSLKI